MVFLDETGGAKSPYRNFIEESSKNRRAGTMFLRHL
jgi:hypothetical protein